MFYETFFVKLSLYSLANSLNIKELEQHPYPNKPMTVLKRFLTFATFLLLAGCSKKDKVLETKILKLIDGKKATVGVAIKDLRTEDIWTINGSKHYPMQSVFKLHLAVKVLNDVDRNVIPINQKIRINSKDLIPDTWSPIAQKYPKGGVELTVAQLLKYAVEQSDNNACDILFKLVGGTVAVHNFYQKENIKNINIAANEAQMHKDWKVQYENWTTPLATIELLEKLIKGKLLSKKSTLMLTKMMVDSPTGPNRIKGLLPKNIPVAHKTGTSATNKMNITAAINDVGVVSISKNKKFVIVVYIKDSKEDMKTNEELIAQISKTAYDFFLAQN
jgi:beta-lactamase class A